MSDINENFFSTDYVIENVFKIDYAKQLAQMLLQINWKYAEALEKTAKEDQVERGYVSARMIEIQHRWNVEIVQACLSLIESMNKTVAHFQKVALDAVRVSPPKL